MALVNLKKTFHSDIATVWRLVTDLHNYTWRSDIHKLEIVDEKQFIAYTEEEIATTFTITDYQPLERYALEVESAKLKGHWTSLFKKVPEGTLVEFTRHVKAGNPFTDIVVKRYLSKQQHQYVADLRRALGE